MPLPLPDPIDNLAADLGRLASGTHHDPHGVLGPARMDYPQAMAAVAVVSHRLSHRLTEG